MMMSSSASAATTLNIEPTTVAPGQSVIVSGTCDNPTQDTSFYVLVNDIHRTGYLTDDNDGSFSGRFLPVANVAGSYSIGGYCAETSVSNEDAVSDVTPITVTVAEGLSQDIYFDKTTVSIGASDSIHFTGRGFTPGSTLTVSHDGTSSTAGIVDDNGNVSGGIYLIGSCAYENTITVTLSDGTSSINKDITVTGCPDNSTSGGSENTDSEEDKAPGVPKTGFSETIAPIASCIGAITLALIAVAMMKKRGTK
jgi:hypothetical protein